MRLAGLALVERRLPQAGEQQEVTGGSWLVNCRTTRLNSGVYRVVTRAGTFGYVMDDMGTLVPINGLGALYG